MTTMMTRDQVVADIDAYAAAVTGPLSDQIAADTVALQAAQDQAKAFQSQLNTLQVTESAKEAEVLALQSTVKQLQQQLAGQVQPSWAGSAFKTLGFQDEYIETSLDPAKWNVRDGSVLGYDKAEVLSKNLFIRGGNLVLAARKELTPHGLQWSSSYCDTIGKVEFQYGLWECRTKLPITLGNSAGLWPAPLWLRSALTKFELDICEGWGTPITNPGVYQFTPGAVSSTVMADTNTHTPKVDNWYLPPAGKSLGDDFHVYGAQLSPAGVTTILDGNPVKTWAAADLKAKGIDLATLAVGKHNIRCNYQVGSPYYGAPNAQTMPYSEILVDWHRVWVQ